MSVEMELMLITGPCTIDIYLQAIQQNLQASISHYHHTRQMQHILCPRICWKTTSLMVDVQLFQWERNVARESYCGN
jgi:hypothetical protein